MQWRLIISQESQLYMSVEVMSVLANTMTTTRVYVNQSTEHTHSVLHDHAILHTYCMITLYYTDRNHRCSVSIHINVSGHAGVCHDARAYVMTRGRKWHAGVCHQASEANQLTHSDQAVILEIILCKNILHFTSHTLSYHHVYRKGKNYPTRD